MPYIFSSTLYIIYITINSVTNGNYIEKRFPHVCDVIFSWVFTPKVLFAPLGIISK